MPRSPKVAMSSRSEWVPPTVNSRVRRAATAAKPAASIAVALRAVAEHADAVTARRELDGDGEGGRDVASAVPGDDDDLGHDDSFGCGPGR